MSMNFKRQQSLVFLIVLILINSISAAEIYQWVDENGKVHFSDKPPAQGKQAKTREVTESKSGKTQQKAQTSVQQRVEKANRWLNTTLTQQKQKLKAQEQAWQEKQQQQAECKVLAQELAEYESAAIIYDYNSQGERYHLNQQQRQQLLDRIRNKIARQCKS
jgi:lysyl-tRNA synthetase class I